ncbi:hypothetical protein QQP08_016161 [Theobroma cacao]|nr:hypothetical protein QQP08_016161 [Theobroma cacao]
MERLKLVQVKWHQVERNGQNKNIYSGSVPLTYIHYLDILIKDFQANFTKLVELTISTKLLQARALFDLGFTHSFVSPCFAAKLGVDHALMEIVQIRNKDTQATLILLNTLPFDVLLGIDLLLPNFASVDCYHKIIRFDYPGESSFSIQGDCNIALNNVVSNMMTRKLLQHGCQGFLVIIRELVKDTRPISIPPYHITLVELKDQLEDLLDKG